MKYLGRTLVCKSIEPLYLDEKDGFKPNTVRVVPAYDLLALGRCERIRVECAGGTPAAFERTITGAFDITEAMELGGLVAAPGERIVEVCWDGSER